MGNETNIAPINEDLNVVKFEVEDIKQKIYIIRGKQIILDSDIAMWYEVETKRINEAVKRNRKRFPEEFCFQLTEIEIENLRSQFATSSMNNVPIASKIVVFRDVQVMIDRDLAELYGVETKRLKEQVNRNIERFPEQFMFQLSLDEYQNVKKSLWSQIATIENNENLRGRHTKYLPYAFTEQGVAMLSAVLRSEKAVRVSIEIMNAFVQMRHYLHNNLNLAGRLTAVENKVDSKFKKIDENFSKIFSALDSSPVVSLR